MRAVLLLLALALGAAAEPAKPPPVEAAAVPRAPDYHAQRTISASRQFLVFCPDANARSRVASYTEEIKASVLQMLGEGDRWKDNILITLDPAPAPAGQPPATLALFQNEANFKLQIDVHLGSDPAQINLHRLLVRALLLEIMYRDQPKLLKPGTAYAEAPWWLVEGARQLYLRRDLGLDTDLFKRIVDVNRLPPLGKFLAGAPHDFDGSAVETMDQACAMCLVQLLIDQPGGRASLAAFVRHWPLGTGDSIADLTKEFPGLAQTEQSLQKWWTVNLARFSAADRYKGFNIAETEARLTAALRLEISKRGTAETESFALADYAEYLKLPASKEALTASHNALLLLGTKSSPIYTALVTEYAAIVQQLTLGKTRGLKSRLAKADQLHADLHKRMTAITDYMNWYEATQTTVRSGKFDGYLKAANELYHPPPRQDPLSKALDEAAGR